MDPWKSWAVIGVGIAAAYFYYNRSNNARRKGGRTNASTAPITEAARVRPRVDERNRKKRDTSAGQSDQYSDPTEISSGSAAVKDKERPKKKRAGKKVPSKLAQTSGVEITPDSAPALDLVEDVGDDGVNDEEFAKQLSGLKTGTSLKAPERLSTSKKSKENKKSNGIASASQESHGKDDVLHPHDISGNSSTTGADADDDLSPAISPAMGATQVKSAESAVSDMLEAPVAGPGVLRLTESAQPQRVSQPKQSKAFEPAETKKQRQRRQQNEIRKIEREEAENERRVLLEKQLRTAREAEGRPAKNGLGAGLSKVPITNAWSPQSNGHRVDKNSASKVSQTSVQLLDTLEDAPNQPTEVNFTADGTNGVSTSNEDKPWSQDMPSEEEQMRMLSEMEGDGGWNTVGAKKIKKKKTEGKVGMQGQGAEKQATSNGTPDIKEPDKKMDENAKPAVKTLRKVPSFGQEDNPDYDPDAKVDERGVKNGRYVPYADSGHPEDSDWPVV
ncbi:hypothetical protein MMC09_003490 [Bachmanniomyces sp. S44760]|nr:hypothetical protein [Bachmanniomyces sp. S44760]